MSVRRLLALAACTAASLAARPASALSVSAVTVQVDPRESHGPCPATITVRGKVLLNGRGAFTYRWERSDGAVDTAVHPPAENDGRNATLVTTSWTLGAVSADFHPFHGWVTLHVLTPTDKTAEGGNFTLDCGAPIGPVTGLGPAGRPTLPAGAAPHLSVVHPRLDSPVLLLPAVLPVAFRGLDGKTLPPGPCDLELSQQPGSDAILIGLLRAGKRVGETSGKFVPGGSTKMDDWEARARQNPNEIHFDGSSKVGFEYGGKGRISCSNNLYPGGNAGSIEFLLPAVQK
jgi:hypothetical protein